MRSIASAQHKSHLTVLSATSLRSHLDTSGRRNLSAGVRFYEQLVAITEFKQGAFRAVCLYSQIYILVDVSLTFGFRGCFWRVANCNSSALLC